MKAAFGLSILFALTVAVGWIMNVVAIAHSSFDVLTGILVLRVVGVFVPLSE